MPSNLFRQLQAYSLALVLSSGMSILLARATNSSTGPEKNAHAVRAQEQYNALPILKTRNIKQSTHPRNCIERGRKYFRLHEFQKAVANYSVAIKMFPQSAEAYSLRAQAYLGLGQYQNQIDDLASAIKLNPKVADLYEKRAESYYKLGQLQNAIDDSITATRLNPAWLDGYRLAATAYEELGWYDEAIDFRTKLIALKTSGALDLRARAKDYELLGKSALAQSDRDKATKLANASERYSMMLCSPLIDLNESTGAPPKESIDRQLENAPVVLSFHYDPGGKICVPVQVNGHSLQLMLDTGCGHSDLWTKAMPKIANRNEVQLRKTGNDQGCQSDFFRVRELKLGNLTLENVAMAVDEGLGEHKTLSGFLGGNILENFVVTIDYSKKQLTLASSHKQLRSTKEIVVPMRIRRHRPYCAITLDGKLNAEALIDTGCPSNLSAEPLLKALLPEKFSHSTLISGPWLGLVAIEYSRLKSLEVGLSKMEGPIFQVFDAEGAPHVAAEIMLGNSFLSRFETVTFDYPGRKLILEPNEDTSESAPNLVSEGHFYAAHDEDRRALEAFGQAMVSDDDFAESCHVYRALIFKELKQHKQAILELDSAIKLDPTYFRAYQYRAECYRYLGDYARQIADDSAVIRLMPSAYFAYLDRAWAYDKLGKHQLANQDRQKAEVSSK